VARISGLGQRAAIAAVVAMLLSGCALAAALIAAADARAQSRDLSLRLVPAAAEAGLLLGQYTGQQTLLRDYVTENSQAALASYRRLGQEIPGQQQKVAALLRGYHRMPAQLAEANAAYRTWLAKVAGLQLAAMARGDHAGAVRLADDITMNRVYSLAVRTRMATLQSAITAIQGRVTSRLISIQRVLLDALLAACAVLAIIAIGGMVVVRRWLLRPFLAIRHATDAIAAGEYRTTVPEAGPAELAALARSAEQMRTRLVDALGTAEKAQQGFRGLFNDLPDATLTVAQDGTILMANAQAEQMFGYTAAELAGQPVEVLVPAAARTGHPAKRAAYFANPVARPMAAGLELTAVARDGRAFPVEISLSSIPTGDGLVAAAAIRDITERLGIQSERDRLRVEADRAHYSERLEQAERLESLGQLVGGVAHDFNNLLNVISGYNGFISEEAARLAETDPRIMPMLADIEQVRGAAERAATLTRQLLTFARRDLVHPQVLSLNDVVRELEHLLRRTLGEHIELIFTPDPGLWAVSADPGQVEQVIVNLAVNARDAMPGGGTLTIDTANIEADETYAAPRPELTPGRYARLRVSDTGTGMPPEVRDRVFEPFYTTKPKGSGTGLGLATVYGIITRAGGHAQVYSEPGLGTTFTALLPATTTAGAPVTPVTRPAVTPAAGSGEAILLIEDEKSLSELTRRILARNGYQVYAAADPEDVLSRAADPGLRIDLLLTDVVMPGMLGNELAARVTEERPGLPVLYMSGYAHSVLDTQGALDPHVDLLEKPFSEAHLLCRVRRALGHVTGHEAPAVGPAAADPPPAPHGRPVRRSARPPVA
jgi:PAS domain S-box-containing protein